MSSYESIRISRDREGFCVSVTDPEIRKANEARDSKTDCCAPWQDPNCEYDFENKAQVLAFLDKAMDIALPADDYSSAFDKLAADAKDD